MFVGQRLLRKWIFSFWFYKVLFLQSATFQDNLSVPSSGSRFSIFDPEGGIDSLSRNLGKKLLLLAA